MHKIHITEGIVLEKRAVGEASVRVTLLTEELGLVRASARSTRVPQSKLKYGLETLTLARFCLVRGKYEWRLTGVELPQRAFAENSRSRTTAGRIAQLLLRLVTGEEPLPSLYKDVAEGFVLLGGKGDSLALEGVALESIEVVLVLRILAHLGYLPRTEALQPFVEQEFSLDLSAKALESKALLVRTINESLKATGL
jgi:DNA repair protein RecO